MRFIATSLLGLVFVGLPIEHSVGAETRTYVLSWIVPAMYAHEGDCRAIEPIADPGSSAVESMFRRILLQLGKTPEEADRLMKDSDAAVAAEAFDLIQNRGRVDGEPVNIYQNPESAPDPQVNTVVGKYAIGFNLDGRGAQSPHTFEDPYTHEKGIDNQYYRAVGCFRSSRVVAPERSAHWQEIWDSGADEAPAFLISISGEDLSRDGDVTVTFDRAIEGQRYDALHKARRDMTFRRDPNPRSHVALPGKIEDGVIILEGGRLKMEGRFITTPFDLTNTHLRLKIMPDGSLDGLLSGYQPWLTMYHFFYGGIGSTEIAFGINVSGVYYALKKLADADPDPVTGQNRRISVAYIIQAVPAFIAPPRKDEPSRIIASAAKHRGEVPMATPMGVTIQVPAGGSTIYSAYRRRSVEAQYFADDKGMALYTYDHDKPNKTSCYGECARAWPPLMAPRGAKAFGDWSLVARRDGGKQWAYLGKPLYRFAKDTVIGDATGVPKPAEKNPLLQKEDEQQSVNPQLAVDRSKEPLAPWKLASYKLAEPTTPHGIFVREVVDANGEALVDVRQMTLYTFDGDPNRDDSSCRAAPCLSPWIPLAAGRMSNPIGDFTLIIRKDGIAQWAYKGKGLYRFRNDREPGNAKGIDMGMDDRWRVALVKQFYLPPQARIQESFGRGKVLTDEHGMTLYRRTATPTEAKPRSVPVMPEEGRLVGTRSCDTQCMKTWIPFEPPADAQAAGFWEIVTREDGKKQWSYKGYALYRYAADERPGDVNGNLVYEIFSNPRLQKSPLDAASQVAAEVKIFSSVALLWSHMYP